MDDFKEIPLFSNYLISKDGRLYDKSRDRILTWHYTKPTKRGSIGGYARVRILRDNGKLSSIGRHRLLALAFLGIPDNVDKMVINHKDGVPGNDTLDNLEWCIRGENNRHAITEGLRTDILPVLARNILTGEEHRFVNAKICAEQLDLRSQFMVTQRINNKFGLRRYADGWLFKRDDGIPWPDVNWLELPIVRIGTVNDYAVYNVHDRVIRIFSGSDEVSDYIKVARGTVQVHIQTNTKAPMNGYIVRYYSKDIKFPIFNDRILAICKDYPVKQPKGLIMTNVETGEETFFTSTKKASVELGLKSSTIWQMSGKKTLWRKKYLFSIFNIHEEIRSAFSEMEK